MATAWEENFDATRTIVLAKIEEKAPIIAEGYGLSEEEAKQVAEAIAYGAMAEQYLDNLMKKHGG